jgi:hypothetical protein
MGRGKRPGAAAQPQASPQASGPATGLEQAELIYSGQAFAIKVTELDYDKSADQLALEGGSGKPDNGSTMYGPYPSEAATERDVERARAYYKGRAEDYAAQYGSGHLDWRVEVIPWPVPKHRAFSDYITEQQALRQGIRPEDVDLRLVFDEPGEVKTPGPRSRRSALAERQQSS